MTKKRLLIKGLAASVGDLSYIVVDVNLDMNSIKCGAREHEG